MSCKTYFSHFYCPKDFHHISGVAVCVDCDILPELCRVKLSLMIKHGIPEEKVARVDG